MDTAAANELAAGGVGTIQLNGTTFVVSQPGPADWAALMGELRRLAKAKALSPMQAVLADLAKLPPHLQQTAIDAAVRLQSATGAKPAEPGVDECKAQMYEPPAVRFWVWHLARKHHAGLSLDDVAPLITEANVIEVLADLARAAKLHLIDPNSIGPAGSTS